jgi:hypothetical protein
MAVTLRELLSDAQDRLEHAHSDARAAALEAVAAFGPIARALDQLYPQQHFEQLTLERHSPDVRALADAAHAAATCWPQAGGHIADLVGAAADAVAIRSRQLDEPQRWALSVEFAETARRAVHTAQQFPPYARIPHLIVLRDAAVACEQRAARSPDAADATALDAFVPGLARTGDLTAIIDAAAALHIAATASPRSRLRVAEVIVTISAVQLATAHAGSYAARLPPEPGVHPWHRPSLSAPDAWQAARLHCRPFDDATKLHPPHDSPIVTAAARLGRTLLDQFGPAPILGVPAAKHAGSDLERASALLTVTTLLPDIAARLQRAVHSYGHTRQLWANERSLLAHEKRGHRPGEPTRIAVPDYGDLERLMTTLRLAGTLTTALASDLGSFAPARLPNLTRVHAMTSAATKVLSPMATTAHDEVRHALLVAPHEWAAPIGPTSRGR